MEPVATTTIDTFPYESNPNSYGYFGLKYRSILDYNDVDFTDPHTAVVSLPYYKDNQYSVQKCIIIIDGKERIEDIAHIEDVDDESSTFSVRVTIDNPLSNSQLVCVAKTPSDAFSEKPLNNVQFINTKTDAETTGSIDIFLSKDPLANKLTVLSHGTQEREGLKIIAENVTVKTDKFDLRIIDHSTHNQHTASLQVPNFDAVCKAMINGVKSTATFTGYSAQLVHIKLAIPTDGSSDLEITCSNKSNTYLYERYVGYPAIVALQTPLASTNTIATYGYMGEDEDEEGSSDASGDGSGSGDDDKVSSSQKIGATMVVISALASIAAMLF